MKRELKVSCIRANLIRAFSRHKANPDEKGTESDHHPSYRAERARRVTKPIPMKRELKDREFAESITDRPRCHKANPDEKGTERGRTA